MGIAGVRQSVSMTPRQTEDTKQGEEVIIFHSFPNSKGKTQIFPDWKITLLLSPLQRRSTLKSKTREKKMVLHGSQVDTTCPWKTSESSGNWIRSRKSVGVALCWNTGKHVVRDPNIMKKRDKGIRLMSTRDVGHRPELREQEVDVKKSK